MKPLNDFISNLYFFEFIPKRIKNLVLAIPNETLSTFWYNHQQKKVKIVSLNLKPRALALLYSIKKKAAGLHLWHLCA